MYNAILKGIGHFDRFFTILRNITEYIKIKYEISNFKSKNTLYKCKGNKKEIRG